MARTEKTGSEAPSILWLRKDLRLSDRPASTAAVEAGAPVIPVYVLDDETPGAWKPGGASRWWLAQSLRSLESALQAAGSQLILRRGKGIAALSALAEETGAKTIFFTRGYEPYRRPLEARLQDELSKAGVECRRFGGHILFEPEKIANNSGDPFRVYTPFFKAVSARDLPRAPLPAPKSLPAPSKWPRSDRLEAWGLEPAKPGWASGLRESWTAGEQAARKRLLLFIENMLRGYRDRRNIPGVDGTSRLSPHLAFGEIGPHQIWRAVLTAAEEAGRHDMGEPYLREIVWREFSYHLLFNWPTLPQAPFRAEFAAFPWQPDAGALQAWQRGQTGYPIVDAGMRELWHTGYMHNRVRMIVGSFLVKHLLIPWTAGEAWFWDTLVDADLANNSASWQWIAGCGADAAPYFRIFNPIKQGQTFDPEGDYVRRWVPELAALATDVIHAPWAAPERVLHTAGVVLGKSYPAPIVDHAMARERALAAFKGLKR